MERDTLKLTEIKIKPWILYPVAVLYMELVLRLFTQTSFFGFGLIYLRLLVTL